MHFSLLLIFLQLYGVVALLCPANPDACTCPNGLIFDQFGLQCRMKFCLSSPSDCIVIESFPSADAITNSQDSCELQFWEDFAGNTDSGTLLSHADGVGLFSWNLPVRYNTKRISHVSFNFIHSNATTSPLLQFSPLQSNIDFRENNLVCLEDLSRLNILPNSEKAFAEMQVAESENEWISNSLDVTRYFLLNLPQLESRFQLAVTSSAQVTLGSKETQVNGLTTLRMEIYSPPHYEPLSGKVQLKEEFESAELTGWIASSSWQVRSGSPFGGRALFISPSPINFVSQLYSPWISLPSFNYILRFKHSMLAVDQHIGGYLEYREPSSDWKDAGNLFHAGGYNQIFDSHGSSSSQRKWSGMIHNATAILNLSAFKGKAIQFRWSWVDARSHKERGGGWWIDSVEVVDQCGNGEVDFGEECDQTPHCLSYCRCKHNFEAKEGFCVHPQQQHSTRSVSLRDQIGSDTCENAATISIGTITDDLTLYTPGELPPHSCNPQPRRDAWFRFFAPSSGNLTVSTCGTWENFIVDTVISIYSSCSASNQLGCNDDHFQVPGCGFRDSEISLEVNTGFYYIRVAPWYLDQDVGPFFLNVNFVTMNPTDTCLGTPFYPPGRYTGETTSYSPSGFPPLCGSSANSAKDVWFAVSLPHPGQLTVSTCGSGIDTVLGVYADDCSTALLCNDDNGRCQNFRHSWLTLPTEAGIYNIRIHPWFDTDEGFFSLLIAFVSLETEITPTAERNYVGSTIQIQLKLTVLSEEQSNYILMTSLQGATMIPNVPPLVNSQPATLRSSSANSFSLEFPFLPTSGNSEELIITYLATVEPCNPFNTIRVESQIFSESGWDRSFFLDIPCVPFLCQDRISFPELSSSFMKNLVTAQYYTDTQFLYQANQYQGSDLEKLSMQRYAIPSMEVALDMLIQEDEPLEVHTVSRDVSMLQNTAQVQYHLLTEEARWIPIIDTETQEITGYRFDV